MVAVAQDYCKPLESVLLIDDSRTVRRFVEVVLGDAGYRVITASDVESGLSALTDAAPDLILLDVRMPGSDTLSVATALQERNIQNETVMLLYSGKSTPEMEALAARCGAHGFCTRPMTRGNCGVSSKTHGDATTVPRNTETPISGPTL